MRETVYIAGPYRAATAEGIALNVARAESLAALAARQGLAPVVIHSMSVAVFGPEEDPETHERAIQTGEALAAQCDHFWAILDSSGGLSSGSAREFDAWAASTARSEECEAHPWAYWLDLGAERPTSCATCAFSSPVTFADGRVIHACGLIDFKAPKGGLCSNWKRAPATASL